MSSKKRKRRKRPFVAPPGPGRNEAVRPGAGTHTPAHQKRLRDRERRDIDEQRDEAEGG